MLSLGSVMLSYYLEVRTRSTSLNLMKCTCWVVDIGDIGIISCCFF